MSRIENRLLSPTSDDLAFVRHYHLGGLAALKREYDEAIREYQTLCSLDAGALVPHIDLAWQLFRAKDCRKANQEFEKANSMAAEYFLPVNDKYSISLLEQRADVLASSDCLNDSRKLMDRLIENSGEPESRLFQRRADVWERMRNYGAALDDLYFAKHLTSIPNSTVEKLSDSAAIFKRFDEAIVRDGDDLGKLYARRAHFLELLGNREEQVEQKRRCYEDALADWQRAMEHQDCKFEDALFKCGLLSAKLKDRELLVQFRDSLRELDKDSLSAKILDVHLLELSGEWLDVQAAFPALKREILKKAVPNKRAEKAKPADAPRFLPGQT